MVAPARAPANAPTAMLNRFISILTSVGSHRRVGAALVQVPEQVPEVFAAQKLDANFLGACQVCAAIPPGPLPERNEKSGARPAARYSAARRRFLPSSAAGPTTCCFHPSAAALGKAGLRLGGADTNETFKPL